MKKLYLVDVSAMFFRAYYAIPPMSTKSGLPTNSLYGFLSMTLKLLRDGKPDYMVFCRDRKEPSFRVDLYADYKGNREEMPDDLQPQMPYISQLSEALGIPQYDLKGYEADDIIGSLTTYGKAQGLEVIIVSGDKDFAQLIGPGVTMFDSMKNKIYDEAAVVTKWGVHPRQFLDYLALIGDSSDNVPGVKGVGPKTAQKLLADYDNLDGVYQHLDEVKGKALKEKLTRDKEMAYLSKELVTIKSDLKIAESVEDLKLKDIDRPGLTALLEELEFKSFADKLLNYKDSQPDSAARVEKLNSSGKKVAAAKAAPAKKKRASKSSTENTGEIKTWTLDDFRKIEPYSDIWVELNERGFYIDVAGQAASTSENLQEVGRILSSKLLSWKGFDLKKTWRELQVPDAVAVWDSMLAAYCLRAGDIKSFSDVVESYLDEKIPDLADANDYFRLHKQLEVELTAQLEELDLKGVYETLELPCVRALYHMVKAGIRLDSDELKRQSKELEVDIAELEKSIHELAGEKFNIASPKQLGHILFDKLGLPVIKKTKTGYSTNSDVLQKLTDEHPIPELVLSYRELAKLKSTYVDALPQLVDKETGRIHTHLKQAATTTGRLSSQNPNLQNIPIRTERGKAVRKAFLASEGQKLLSVDYSQIELRVLAHITEDKNLVKAFTEDLDIHAATAAEVFEVPLDQVTSDLRRKAKAINFGIAYGQGAFGLADSLNIPRKEGQDIIKRYFQRFPNVRNYMQETVEQAKELGYVETIFGRRRYLPELSSSNGMMRKFGERAAINAPIQGTASDIMKKAMNDVFANVSATPLLQVHDEILFECPEADVVEQIEVIQQIMESVVELKVPLKVNSAVGQDWHQAHA
ncbi:MAG: DNA polymerase I [Bdellovibrionaceae bacterium]|nr:DNA polymerase I [Pseudobdellovibrionaceae bacterium]